MGQQGIDSIILFAGYIATVVLVMVMIYRGMNKSFPVFTSYLVFGLINDPLIYWIFSHNPDAYPTAFAISSAIDFAFQLGVLLEIAMNVIRPVKRSLPPRIIWVLGGFFLIASAVSGAIAFKVLPHSAPSHFVDAIQMRMSLGMALLRMGIFVSIAVFAQLLGIGWKNHVLQLATGLAFYSAVSLIVETAHSRAGLGPQFHALDQMVAASYLGTLLFWTWSFVQQEVARKEFSPQMQNFLLSIAGTTRSSRMGLEAAVNSKSTSRKR
jgi:hypothetical protein